MKEKAMFLTVTPGLLVIPLVLFLEEDFLLQISVNKRTMGFGCSILTGIS